MATLNLKLGQTIETRDGRRGTVRYIGGLHIAEGDWLGLELSDASGKNDGSVKGERYFSCQPNHGIFVRKESVVKVIRQATPVTAATVEATATAPTGGSKPRPGSGVNADVTRKRQSLMSPALNGTAGSRLSIRSPTKSPMKPPSTTSTTHTSAASTPRTGTPATTARTSDSSAKSRASTASRKSVVPSTAVSRTVTNGSRASLSTAQKASRPSSITSRPLSTAKRPSTQTGLTPRQSKPEAETNVEQEIGLEEIADQAQLSGDAESHDANAAEANMHETMGEQTVESTPDENSSATKTTTKVIHTQSSLQPKSNGTAESRAAQIRDLEQLRAKIRTLEKQRSEDSQKLEQHDALQSENERYRNIIQALQSKLKVNQQDVADLRAKFEEAQSDAASQPQRSAEQEAVLEIATLDKEMAEEKAEAYHMELDALKAKHEELELELEILREENQELGSVMSPEEKASAGWLQMERERERLRDALVMLRDMTQQTENDLKAEIKELQENLDDVESTASKYIDTAQKLSKSEETNRHLVEQLEAIESNDEVVVAMEAQREQHLRNIEQLKKQIQELEEHIQVTDELENFHVDEERRLHAQIDESEALLNESTRQNLEQDRVIEDLEYTLTKFRDVVQGLQNDIDELRRSRDISESQANEMSSKSRAMMDLNLRLQNNAAKSQSKTIDSELDKIRAELGENHVEMLSLFTMESFESERNPILALLCFRRLHSKAELASKLLNERVRERAHLSPGEEIFTVLEVIERFQWIAGTCQRFEKFMSTCGTDSFTSCGAALHEIEPVERVITGWLEALRRDELGTDDSDHLFRMQGILTDLAEKLIVENFETKSTELLVQTRMLENFADSMAGQFSALMRTVQSKLGGPMDEDEESLVFDKKMDQLTTKARTIKYLSSKVVQQLADLRTNCMCLGETYWVLFEDAERQAEALAKMLRKVGILVAEDLSKFEPEQSSTYTTMLETLTAAVQRVQSQHDGVSGANSEMDVFAIIGIQLNNLQAAVDDLSNKSNDISTAIEFEPSVAPWTLRSRQLKSQKIIPLETQEEMTRLERRSQELNSKVLEREKMIEELNMRVELAEKRVKDSRAKDEKDKVYHNEVESLRTENQEAEKQLKDLRAELQSYMQKSDQDRIELETLRKATNGEIIAVPGTPGLVDERNAKQVQLEVTLLQAEITALQAAVRFLREENHNLRVPTTEIMVDTARSTWLEPLITSRNNHNSRKRISPQQKRLRQEAQDIYVDLIDVASTLKPVKLSTKLQANSNAQPVRAEETIGSSTSAWQPITQTTRYAILQQREELEKWNAQKSDFVARAKIIQNSLRPKQVHASSRRPKTTLYGSRQSDIKSIATANHDLEQRSINYDDQGAASLNSSDEVHIVEE